MRTGRTPRTVVALVGVAILASGCSGIRYATDADGRVVDRSAVRSVQLGMLESEVVARLGAPAAYESPMYGGKTLRYGDAGPATQRRTALWVHLDSRSRVACVYSKLYKDWSFGDDDEMGAYGLAADQQWESAAFPLAFPDGSEHP